MATAFADMSTALALIPQPVDQTYTDQNDVMSMVRRFEEAENTTRPAREKAERDRDYYDGKQWTATETKELEKRGQPVVTFNRIQRKVNFLKGLESQTRKDPKAFPREPNDDGAAQAATDALRYVCDASDWNAIRSKAFEFIIVEGTAAILVGAKQGKQGIDPDLIQIAWDRFYYDPHSAKEDFSDAGYMGIVTWMDYEDAQAKWPDRADILDATMSNTKASDTYDDRPKSGLWADPKRKRIRVNEEYYKTAGQWMRCVYTRSGFLEDPEPSPYHDADRKPANPICAISAYVDRDNNRYGEVRALISPQDEVNKRRSKGLHLINSRQMRISRSAQIQPSDAKREMAKPDGILIADQGEVEPIQTGDMAAANFQMLQEAKAEIDLLGPNAALQGKNENELSGRAMLAQQQGGMTEIALLMDRLRHLSLKVYDAIWARVRQYWTEQRWIRITDDPRDPQFVGLNQPKTLLDLGKAAMSGDQNAQQTLQQQAPQVAQAMQAAQQGDPQAKQALLSLAQSPMAHQVMKIENNVGEIEVDITMDEGMDTPTVQAEQFDMIMKMLPTMVGLPPAIQKLIIQMSSLRDKDQLLAMVDQLSQVDPVQLMKQQRDEAIQTAGAISGIKKTDSETVKNVAAAQATQANVNAELMNAETARLHRAVEAGVNVHQALNPEPVQQQQQPQQ